MLEQRSSSDFKSPLSRGGVMSVIITVYYPCEKTSSNFPDNPRNIWSQEDISFPPGVCQRRTPGFYPRHADDNGIILDFKNEEGLTPRMKIGCVMWSGYIESMAEAASQLDFLEMHLKSLRDLEDERKREADAILVLPQITVNSTLVATSITPMKRIVF